MNLQTLASHTVNLDLLPGAPRVLDVGCRNFDFTRAILKVRPRAEIVAMDPDRKIVAPDISQMMFIRAALVGDARNDAPYCSFSTGEANHLVWNGVIEPDSEVYRVPCYSVGSWVHDFDVVKLDCEGSEFGILENWPGPVATQISVEFHDGIFPDRCKPLTWDEYFMKLFDGPLKDYRVVKHRRSAVGPAATWGYWDSLLVLKGVR